MGMRHYPKFPLKFILLWIGTLAVMLILSFVTGFHKALLNISIRNLAYLYLAAGAVLAALEQVLWDKLKGE